MKERSEKRVIRGEIPFTIPMHWRLDGKGVKADSPLVLCLHGQWMTEDLFALLLQKLHSLPFRFLTPRAPYPAQFPGKKKIGASWYPYDGNQDRFLKELAITESAIIRLLLDVERDEDLRPSARLVLGFSQGGYTGSFVALRHSDLFDALIVSGARVKTEVLGDEIAAASERGMRVMICHGSKDKAVPPVAAERSAKELIAGGVETDLHYFDTAHTIGKRQVGAIREWLVKRWNPPGCGVSD